MYDASWHSIATTVHETRAVGVQQRGKGACTTVLSAAMTVTGGIRAIKVHILVAHEATVAVLCEKFDRRDGVPCIAHALLDARFLEWAACQHALLPEVEERIVEGAEPLGCCSRHLDDLC